MPPRPKRLCACGCTLHVTRKVEVGHLNGQRSALLAANILSKNRSLLCRRKKASKLRLMSPSRYTGKQKIIGHRTPPRRFFSSRKTSENPSESSETREAFVTQDLSPRSSPIRLLPDTLADGCDQYGLSTQRRSHRITERVEQIGRIRWRGNHVQYIEREEREPEEEENSSMEDEEDGMGHDDNELEDKEDILPVFAEPGQEGISVWDLLGEGFLKEVTELGWLVLLN
jgi:hypothetical protein